MKLTPKIIRYYSAIEYQLRSELHRTRPFRYSGNKEDYLRWSEARERWHSYESPLGRLWTESFADQVRSGDREAIEELISFLEVDPYFYRSGYLKERLIRLIKNAPRSPREDLRLLDIIWSRASGPNRREFKHFCRLAAKISDPSFKAQVQVASLRKSRKCYCKFTHLLKYLL